MSVLGILAIIVVSTVCVCAILLGVAVVLYSRHPDREEIDLHFGDDS